MASSSLFGVVTSKKGWTFPEMILKRAKSGETLRVVNDQYMSPTYTLDLVKMTLARLAAGEAGVDGLDDYLLGPTALAFARTDPVSTAKALKDFSKANEVFVLKAGYLSGNVLSPEEVSRLADIEPREVLLAKMAGAFKAPLYKAAGMFGSFTRDAASMFDQLLTKKESGEFALEGGPSGATLPAEEPTETETAAKAEEE